MTIEDIKKICEIYDNFRRERDAATIAYNSEDAFWSHILTAYNFSQPSLPSNLDEAAKDYCNSQPEWENKILGWVEEKDKEECRRDFKAGAEWMAEQGYTTETRVDRTPLNGPIGICLHLHDSTGFKINDKVIVQIRKK